MKCDKCGYQVNPGDQVCINCGAPLSSENAIIPEVDGVYMTKSEKKNRTWLIFVILGVILFIVIVFLLVRFFVLGAIS